METLETRVRKKRILEIMNDYPISYEEAVAIHDLLKETTGYKLEVIHEFMQLILYALGKDANSVIDFLRRKIRATWKE